MNPAVRRIMAQACKGRSQAARIIRGAVTDAYERTAAELLEQTAERAAALGLSEAEHEQACAERLQLLALTAALRVAAEIAHVFPPDDTATGSFGRRGEQPWSGATS